MKRLFCLLFCFAISCGRSAADHLRSRGEAETEKLARLLHDIDTKDDLERKLYKVEKSFNAIADLLLQVRTLPEKPKPKEPSKASDALFAELARLYEMPGCRALLERAQEEAIRRLQKDGELSF